MRHLSGSRAGRVVCAIALTLALASCTGGGRHDRPSTTQTGVFGQVRDTAGSPIAGVQVSLGGQLATTDQAGQYAVRTAAGPAVARFEAPGYLVGVERVVVTADQVSGLDAVLLSEAVGQALDADVGGTIDGTRGAQLIAPASAFIDANGAAATGEVMVHLTPLDPGVAAELAAAPGDLTAVDDSGAGRLLVSQGILDVTVRQDQMRLSIAPGAAVQIRIPAPAGATSPPAEIPLWSFDESAGRWVEEGVATYDPASNGYAATIEHLSWWNADQVATATCIAGCVEDETGARLPGAAVTVTGVDYLGTSDTTAGPDGCFQVAVRASSKVAVLAYHESEGGQQREVDSGDTATDVPPGPGAACLDAGTWVVRRGQVELPDGTIIDCGAIDNRMGGCFDASAQLMDCFAAAGACTYETAGVGGSTQTYANGARIERTLNGTNSVATYYGPDGTPCGEQHVDVVSFTDTQMSSNITVTLPSGATGSISILTQVDSGTMTLTCTDGRSITWSQQDVAIFQACSGQATESCSGAPVVTPGGPCQTDADCDGGLTCCQGTVCMQPGVCPGGCTTDSDCANSYTCCDLDGTTTCLPPGMCTIGQSCSSDADCGSFACCNGACATQCDGGPCTSDGDCGAGEVCCPDPTDPWCTDLQSCYDGRSCTTAADCGASSGLICCSNSGSCATEVDCAVGQACTADADCPTTMQCCDNAMAPGCQTLEACDLGRPCTSDGDCTAPGNRCCARYGNLCFDPTSCFSAAPCTADADCGGVSGLKCCVLSGQQMCIETGVCP